AGRLLFESCPFPSGMGYRRCLASERVTSFAGFSATIGALEIYRVHALSLRRTQPLSSPASFRLQHFQASAIVVTAPSRRVPGFASCLSALIGGPFPRSPLPATHFLPSNLPHRRLGHPQIIRRSQTHLRA